MSESCKSCRFYRANKKQGLYTEHPDGGHIQRSTGIHIGGMNLETLNDTIEHSNEHGDCRRYPEARESFERDWCGEWQGGKEPFKPHPLDYKYGTHEAERAACVSPLHQRDKEAIGLDEVGTANPSTMRGLKVYAAAQGMTVMNRPMAECLVQEFEAYLEGESRGLDSPTTIKDWWDQRKAERRRSRENNAEGGADD